MHVVGLLPKKLCNDLMDRFDSIYEDGVREMQRKLDLTQFGWDCWATDSENGDDDWKGANQELSSDPKVNMHFGNRPQQHLDPKLRDRVAAEWQSVSTETQCVATAKDGAFERIRFVLSMFREHFLEQMVYRTDDGHSSSSERAIYVHLFAECLSGYDAVSLLNDFERVRQHRAGTEELRDCKMSGPLTVCCGELMRQRRESVDKNVCRMMQNGDRLEFQQYIDSLDNRQNALMEITSKIHSLINHANDEDMKQELGDSVWTRRQRKRNRKNSTDDGVSKFVNEMENMQRSKTPKLDELPSILTRSTLSQTAIISFIRYLKSQDMDSDAVDEDLHTMLTPRKDYETPVDSNLFPLLQNDTLTAKSVVSHLYEFDTFRFGYRSFLYWKSCSILGGVHLILSPKYKNLKEECLQNTIYPIPKSLFVSILEMARTLRRTNKGRSLIAVDRSDYNRCYELPSASPLSISHIFVLLMYCKYTVLQYKYKKFGCREMTDIQSEDDPEIIAMAERNRAIGWWYRLITESVMFWGAMMTENDTFFTGLSCKMAFNNMMPVWNCPFSSTVSSLVAVNFASEEGVILKMKSSSYNYDRYFDCEWLSEYPHERERLFVQAANLKITDIRTFDFEEMLWTSNKHYIECLSLFSNLFRGEFISNIFKKMKNKTKMEEMLLSMIRYFETRTLTQNDIDLNGNVEMSLYEEHLITKAI